MQTKAEYAHMAVHALGGPTLVGKMLGLDQRVISNWCARGFPPDVYAPLAPLLTARGITAPPGMFGQRALVITKPKRQRRTKQELQHASTG
jgi:hypothetical protein